MSNAVSQCEPPTLQTIKQNTIAPPHAERPTIIAIGGSDSSGMAGLQSDIKTIQALGGHAQIVCTANTAQNTHGVNSINPVDPATFSSQLNSVIDNKKKNIIKIGLLASCQQVFILKALLENLPDKEIILDPVFSASSGESFGSVDVGDAIKQHLLPISTLATPNLIEAEFLSDTKIDSIQTVEYAAKKILDLGVSQVLIKGGHQTDFFCSTKNDDVSDYFCDQENQFWLKSPRIDTPNSRGTGCALASSIATTIGLKYSYKDAIVIGKMSINQGLRQSYTVAGQHGPVNILYFPHNQEDLPTLSPHYNAQEITPFPAPLRQNNSTQDPLGLYPIVDSAHWLERLLPLGISTIQLRIKTGDSQEIEQEIIKSIYLAKQYNARLFINDYWQLAIKHKAYGVHLGQEDLFDADIQSIKNAGLRLGVSTHCHYEVARAHSLRPSYIACGPIYHTNTKQMPWIPHGAEGFAYWRTCLGEYPLVAIGGINKDRIEKIVQQGADGIAIISAITQAQEPELQTKILMKKV